MLNDPIIFFKNQQAANTLAPCWLLKTDDVNQCLPIAFSIAKEILYSKPSQPHGMPDTFINKQVEQNAYPNFLYVTSPLLEDGTKTTEIKIEEAKKINLFLKKKPAVDGWRVIIINTIDDMNRFAANSLLKIMEEPPQKTLILLIVKQPGFILPTIRSRCQVLKIKTDFTQIEESSFFKSLEQEISLYFNARHTYNESFFKTIIKEDPSLKNYKYTLLKLIHLKFKNPQNFLNNITMNDISHWAKVFEALNTFFNACHQAHLDNMQVLINSFAALKKPELVLNEDFHGL